MNPKDIIIRCDEESKFLRTEALSKAIEYEELYMNGQQEGSYHCVLWIKKGTTNEWQIRIHHTKTAIIVNIHQIKSK